MSEPHNSAQANPVLSAQGLSKIYPGTRALDGFDLVLHAGEIHGLAGLNGAGKSTVIKLLSGVEPPTAGTITLAGHGPVSFGGPGVAQLLGIGVVHQEVPMLPNLTAAENMVLGAEGRGGLSLARRRSAERRYREVAKQLPGAPPAEARLAGLSLYSWQIVAIIRAVAMNARAIILDEPTSSLSSSERRALHALLRRLTDSGIAILYVSHFLDDILEAASVVSVLRDGRLSFRGSASSLTTAELLSLMTGDQTPPPSVLPDAEASPSDAGTASAPAAAAVSGLRVNGLCAQRVNNVSLRAAPGERVGLFGLEDSGARELLESVFGLRDHTGHVTWMGRAVPTDTRGAVRAGIALVSGDRRRSVFAEWSVALNHALPQLVQRPLLSRARVPNATEAVASSIKRFEIKATAEQRMGELSGGNQQKALIARWLGGHGRCLLLDEPTRGVDLAGRGAIHERLREISAAGSTLVVHSTDPEEIVELCQRVLIVSGGQIVAETSGAEITASRLEHLTRDRALHQTAA